MKLARLSLFLLLTAIAAFADPVRGTTIAPSTLYISPDQSAQKLTSINRGREVVLLDKTNNSGTDWVQVMATVEPGHDLTGWMLHRDAIFTSDPNGDQLLFGEAVDSEMQAEKRGGRKGAAQDAMMLYNFVAEQYPKSALAGEAMWRAGDIRWQLERADVFSRPSAREKSPDARGEINEDYLHEVEKKFPHTKWADLAAYDMIDNKICGDWQGDTKCPEKETEIYLKYAEQHPQSPKLAEALYNAAWRQAALVDMYKSNEEQEKSEKARKKAIEIAQRAVAASSQAAASQQQDWSARARALIYMLQQGIPLYGNATD